MPRLEFSERFADDLAAVTSVRVEAHILRALDGIEAFGAIGSPVASDSIRQRFGDGVRRVVVAPFEIVYTYYPEHDLVQVEALIYARAIR